MGSILWEAECSNVHHPDNHVLHRLLIHPFQQIMHISPFLAHIDSVHNKSIPPTLLLYNVMAE